MASSIGWWLSSPLRSLDYGRAKGFKFTILVGVGAGYLLSIPLGLVNFTTVLDAPWLAWPKFMLPAFSWKAIAIIAPLALVTIIEHIGDIKANGSVVGKDFVESPGLDRTLLGDGLATVVAGFLGGPANTTYSENTGVLALTKVYDLQFYASGVMAIYFLWVSSVPNSRPSLPFMGGISIVLFGMIASVGLRAQQKIRLTKRIETLLSYPNPSFGISGATPSALIFGHRSSGYNWAFVNKFLFSDR